MRWTTIMTISWAAVAMSCGLAKITPAVTAGAAEPPPATNPPTPPPADGPVVVTDDQMLTLLDSSCVQCHGGDHPKAHVALDTIAGATAAAARAKDEVANGDMPPSHATQPSDDDKAKMLAWFTAHAG